MREKDWKKILAVDGEQKQTWLSFNQRFIQIIIIIIIIIVIIIIITNVASCYFENHKGKASGEVPWNVSVSFSWR